MFKLSYKNIFVSVLLSATLVGCGAKDNLVEGMTPEVGSGSISALKSGPKTVSGKGEQQATNYANLFLQKAIETAKLFGYVTSLTDGQSLECGIVSKSGTLLSIDYYSQNNTGECQDYLNVGREKFVTTIDGASFENYKIKRSADGTVSSVKLIKKDSDIKLNLGIHKAPKRFVNADSTLSRSFNASSTACAAGVIGNCYKVSSRLLIKTSNLSYSPSKNSPIKFKESNGVLDFRFDFVLNIDGEKENIIFTNRKNQLFIKGTRAPFNKRYDSDYRGKLYLVDLPEGTSFNLNNDNTNNCGYFDSLSSSIEMRLNWNRTANRNMERRFTVTKHFLADKISTTVKKDGGAVIFTQDLFKDRCINFTKSTTAPFYNNYLLFAY